MILHLFFIYNVIASRLAGLLFRVVAFAIAQQHEAAGDVAEGYAPLVHQLVAVVAVEGLFATGYDAAADAEFCGCQHHVLRTAEGIWNAVEEITLGEDDAHRGGIESCLDDTLQVFPGYLPFLVFADGTAVTDEFK